MLFRQSARVYYTVCARMLFILHVMYLNNISAHTVAAAHSFKRKWLILIWSTRETKTQKTGACRSPCLITLAGGTP
jgi:hypothetical protein